MRTPKSGGTPRKRNVIEQIFTEEELDAQFEEFLAELQATQREGIENLIAWLRRGDLRIAPSSTKYHLSCPGGLVRHSLNVLARLRQLVKIAGFEGKYDDNTLRIAALCHDLCKVNYYEIYTKNVKNEELNKWVKEEFYRIREDDNRLIYGLHAENSIFNATRFINLTYVEQVAIRWHMGCLDWQDNNAMVSTMGAAFNVCPLAFLLHTADQMAAYLDEGNKRK